MKCVCPHCGITNRQRQNTTNPVVCQLRSAKRKHFWATPPCRAGRLSTAIHRKKVYLAQLHISSSVYQPRSGKRKHAVVAIYQQRSGHQSDSTAGRHGRDCQSGIFTATSKPEAYMAQLLSPAPLINRNQQRKTHLVPLYMNRDQQSKIMSGAPDSTAIRKVKQNPF